MPLGNIMNVPSGKLKNIIVDQVDSMETTMAHIIPEMTANILGPIVLFTYMLILDWRLEHQCSRVKSIIPAGDIATN